MLEKPIWYLDLFGGWKDVYAYGEWKKADPSEDSGRSIAEQLFVHQQGLRVRGDIKDLIIENTPKGYRGKIKLATFGGKHNSYDIRRIVDFCPTQSTAERMREERFEQAAHFFGVYGNRRQENDKRKTKMELG